MTPSVLLHGGGTTAAETTKRVIALAGGPESPLVVLAHTGEDVAGKGKRSVDWLRENGAKNVTAPVAIQEALTLVSTAAGVWIPGGDQSLLMAAFAGTDLTTRLRDRRVVGGTSAGASLMGSLMPTGNGDAKLMRPGSVEVKPGLCALTDTIVDSHFFVRERTQRLLNMIYSQPVGTRGIGVDEDAWCEIVGQTLLVRSGQVLMMQRNKDNIMVKILKTGDREKMTNMVSSY
jgi:cyanophycinase